MCSRLTVSRDAGQLESSRSKAPEIRIVDEASEVALEVAVIDRIEADERGEQAPVGLGDAVAEQVALFASRASSQSSVSNKRPDRFLVGRLGAWRSRPCRRRC